MASNTVEPNGNKSPVPPTQGRDIKILVIGKRNCGKSLFITAFTNRNHLSKKYSDEYANASACQYDFRKESRGIKIFEFVGDHELVEKLIELHFDANGFVFVYAVDDPSSFQEIHEKWIKPVYNVEKLKKVPCILVGNKKDLRRNQETIQRPEQNNQDFVTHQQGKSLARQRGMEFFECSSIDESDGSIHDAFDSILNSGLQDWIRDEN